MLDLLRFKNDNKKNVKLIEIIDEMSKTQVQQSIVINQLNEIYSDGFRHSCSMIFEKLIDLDIDERDIVSESISELVNNYIKNDCLKETHVNEQLISGLIDLKEYINLELSRIQLDKFAEEKLTKSMEKVDNIKSYVNDLEKNMDKFNEEVDVVEHQMRSQTTQSITILSIFAGLVFVFTGGFSFISTALQNINIASVYKLTYILMLVGMFIYNLVFLFFYIISKITNRSISGHCLKTRSFECGQNEECNNCKWYNKVIRKFWYIIIPNVFFILSMILSVIMWFIRRG